MDFRHTVILALSLNGCAFDDQGRKVLAFIPPLLTQKYYLPAALYDALGDAATWARAAWDVVAGPWAEALIGPGWWGDLVLIWEAVRMWV